MEIEQSQVMPGNISVLDAGFILNLYNETMALYKDYDSTNPSPFALIALGKIHAYEMIMNHFGIPY